MSSNHDRPAGSAPAESIRFVIRELPHVTLLFMVLKIVATTLGETGGDLAQTLHVGYLVATVIFMAMFLARRANGSAPLRAGRVPRSRLASGRRCVARRSPRSEPLQNNSW
jgi:hypothetical protein